MKILFINDFPLWGSGSGTYLRNLIKELVKLNHTIGVIAPEDRRFLENKIKQYKVESSLIPVFIGHPELKGAKRYSELSAREITETYKTFLDTTLDAISNFQPDIIHVNHLSLISWVARYINGIEGTKYIITIHGSCLSNLLENKRYLPLSEDSLKNAKKIIAVSDNVRTRLHENFGKEIDKNISTIPGGVDMKSFPLKKNTSSIDKKYNLKGKKVVLFSGRLSSEKGIKYLVSAANNIKAEIFIAGDGPEKQLILDTIAKQKITNIHLLGYLMPEELIDFYYRADVFVAPSIVEEAMGLSVLEAMAAQTPVIITRRGGLLSLIKNNNNGLFVPPKNSSKIAEACNKLLSNDSLRENMGKAAREMVEKNYTWEKTAKAHDSLYKRISGNGKNNL
jgi:glycosyltransferase involved in cell wall biosynthesis